MRDSRTVLVKAAGSEYVDYAIEAMGRWVIAAEEGKLG